MLIQLYAFHMEKYQNQYFIVMIIIKFLLYIFLGKLSLKRYVVMFNFIKSWCQCNGKTNLIILTATLIIRGLDDSLFFCDPYNAHLCIMKHIDLF